MRSIWPSAQFRRWRTICEREWAEIRSMTAGAQFRWSRTNCGWEWAEVRSTSSLEETAHGLWREYVKQDQSMRRHGIGRAWCSPPQIQATCPAQGYGLVSPPQVFKYIQFIAHNVTISWAKESILITKSDPHPGSRSALKRCRTPHRSRHTSCPQAIKVTHHQSGLVSYAQHDVGYSPHVLSEAHQQSRSFISPSLNKPLYLLQVGRRMPS